jgi:hypothetical protein
VAVAVSAPVVWEPLIAFVPDQAPEAVQEVAFVADQVKAELLPLTTELGLAFKLTVGAGVFTDTVADCVALPPSPVQVKVYVASAVSAPVDCDPVSGLLPDQAFDAEHAVALVADQFSVALLPLVMALGPTLNVTTGVDDLTDTVTD